MNKQLSFQGFDINVCSEQKGCLTKYIFLLQEKETQQKAKISIAIDTVGDNSDEFNVNLEVLEKATNECEKTLEDFWKKYVKFSDEKESPRIETLLPIAISEFRNLQRKNKSNAG